MGAACPLVNLSDLNFKLVPPILGCQQIHAQLADGSI
jgi:hypothetical protein